MEQQSQGFLKRIIGVLNDKVALKQEEITLTQSAQPLPFTGIKPTDVYAVEIRILASGTPTKSSNIANFTMVVSDTPTSTHGMYLGDGDYYEITNQANIQNFKIIATENLAHVCHIIYYGN